MNSTVITKIAAGLLLACGLSAANAGIITNGDFEQGLTGWSCTGADYCTTSATGGVPGAEMLGYDNIGYTSLSQTVATAIGATYQLSFYSKATYIQGNEIGYSFSGFSNVVWVPITLAFTQSLGSFTAVGAKTTVEFFMATDPGTGTFALDTVSMVQTAGAVPEPGALALIGLGLAGFAAVRRQRKA